MPFPDQPRLNRPMHNRYQVYWRVLLHSLVLLLCLVAVGARADTAQAVYQPPADISADDRQAALDQLNRFVAKLEQLRAEIEQIGRAHG